MARMHGTNCRIYLGGRDISGDIAEISPKFGAASHDVTNFASAGWMEADPGLLSWDAAFRGYYDPAVGGYGRQTESLLGASGGILSIYEGDADAIGDKGFLFGDSVLETRDNPISVNDIIKLDGALKGNGRVGFQGRLLHVLGQETISGDTATLDNLASSANGGLGILHVMAVTGSWTIKIQHSANDIDWVDLVTFTQVTAGGGVTAEAIAAAGTVNRYLQVTFTEDVVGSITFIVGFARY